MADALRQFAFPVQPFGLAHFFGPAFYLVQVIGHFLYASRLVIRYRLTQLAQAELHIMEIGNGLAQLVGNVGQHSFEVTESQTYQFRVLRIDGFTSDSVRDESHNAPIGSSVCPIRLSVFGRPEVQRLALYVAFSPFFQSLPDVSRDGFDVSLQQVYVLEHVVVDAL